MKSLVAVLLFCLAQAPALAAAEISAQQLTDIVVSAEARRQSDKDLARKIAGIELTQRLTDDTLATLLHRAPGPQTREALQAVADESTFLDPPASELPDQPAPTLTEQKASLEKARNYTATYVTKLPNFFCTLIVRRFDDARSGNGLRLHDIITGDLTLAVFRPVTGGMFVRITLPNDKTIEFQTSVANLIGD